MNLIFDIEMTIPRGAVKRAEPRPLASRSRESKFPGGSYFTAGSSGLPSGERSSTEMAK
jgi:hypothetical protein